MVHDVLPGLLRPVLLLSADGIGNTADGRLVRKVTIFRHTLTASRVFSGLIVAISTFTGGSRNGSGATGGDYFIGFILILITTGWVIAALADFFILTKIHGYYRATGASISKAQAEFTTNVFSNEAVRNAAASAAAAGVRQGFQVGGTEARGQRGRYLLLPRHTHFTINDEIFLFTGTARSAGPAVLSEQ